ncbi:hypothetical protein EYF80_001412 [Liparis tanakae]|uniref:Uncharacterized protein n=1 Tax=Liparis tanakae TaxID=230148 RepID=A0A4Z2JD82_9TELE|nr:hypothetical protein EYF80_001412 [Liparis tanakae]
MAEAPEAAGARSPPLSVTRPRLVLPVNDDHGDPLRRLPGSPPARSVPATDQIDGGQRVESYNRSAMRAPSLLSSQQPITYPHSHSWPAVPLTCQGRRVGTSQRQAARRRL